ncbi:MAG TPA: lactate utilization protein [Pyrinomonadaceae bacterium]|jgi:L-lactate utilization protein LutB
MKTESDVDDKEAMFRRIRAALGRGEGSPAPLPLEPFARAGAGGAPHELVERFRREAEAAGVRVAFADTDAEAREYLLASVLPGEGATVALSDAFAAGRRELAEWLSGRGLRVVVPQAGPQAGPDDAFRAALFEARVGLTLADYAIAETGTLVLLSGGERHRLVSLAPPVHVCLLDARRIVGTMGELLSLARGRDAAGPGLPQALTFITGPSRTADVEQTLALGVHGPHEVHVLLRRGS